MFYLATSVYGMVILFKVIWYGYEYSPLEELEMMMMMMTSTAHATVLLSVLFVSNRN